MKLNLIIVLIAYVASGLASEPKATSPGIEVIHIKTALDHLTVLEFGEQVTMAAAGSPAFQIERHDDKVFVKPLKTGACTDLFVWTNSRRFTYELEPPGEIKDLNFAVESLISPPKSLPDNIAQAGDIADTLLTRAFLDAERISSRSIKDEKGRITIRIEQVFQSRMSLYVHYSIVNHSAHMFSVTTPTVAEALAPQAAIPITSLLHQQLDAHLLGKLGELRERSLPPTLGESKKKDLQPGEETHGVVVIREQFSNPTILRLMFGSEELRGVQAVVVL